MIHIDPEKCEVAPIKHAPEECNGRTKEYMKFRGKPGRKDETEVCNATGGPRKISLKVCRGNIQKPRLNESHDSQ